MFMHFKRPEYVPVCIYALNNYTINYKICRFFYKKAPKYVLIDKSNRLYIYLRVNIINVRNRSHSK